MTYGDIWHLCTCIVSPSFLMAFLPSDDQGEGDCISRVSNVWKKCTHCDPMSPSCYGKNWPIVSVEKVVTYGVVSSKQVLPHNETRHVLLWPILHNLVYNIKCVTVIHEHASCIHWNFHGVYIFMYFASWYVLAKFVCYVCVLEEAFWSCNVHSLVCCKYCHEKLHYHFWVCLLVAVWTRYTCTCSSYSPKLQL